MDIKKFSLWNNIVSAIIFLISAFTYLSTIEPSASFWDCGEFIASSFKFEVGHPPGNPVFQLIARFFTIFAAPENAAIAVNAMSALCSAFTIFFLYLTIVFFAKRMLKPASNGNYSIGQAIAIYGSGAVGALAYCFSDTFWFSAVEGEVYAMSSLFTAMVFWAMTKWYEQAESPYANRWIVLISFLMGLSIGVHLLNLLAIPAIVFMYFYRKREEGHYTLWEYVKIFLISVIILALILFFIIPYLPKFAAYTDILFVNTFGLPVNSGAAFFVIALLTASFWGLSRLYKANKVFWTTTLLCFTTIVIGFSIFSVVVIRSSVMTPTNENQPDNAFSLIRYLSREQYGKTPLIYGQYFGSPYASLKAPKYWTLINGKYKHVTGPVEAEYSSGSKMLFPRMWNNQNDKYIKFYQSYMDGKGTDIPGSKYKKPTFGTNLKFFFDFQLNWMYWRYFMWNFAGRQNDIHSPSPGEIFYGNWESGIKPLDNIRLGNQDNAPEILKHNKAKNHYFLLPLLLGIIGLFFQFDKDKRGSWLTFLLFFMTGIAIVIYLNQPPYQVRERDYAYAGSFYAFAIWIGFAVAAIYEWIQDFLKEKHQVVTASVVSLLLLGVPALMAQQNWDDHDRSNRRTAVEMATNYLNSVGRNGILITHGDNDTFPLWYAQEVEGIRTDVRIANTSLLGTDWYIGQMKYTINDSPALDLKVGPEQYLYGTNEFIRIHDTRNQIIPIADVMAVFRHPGAKITLEDGSKEDYIVSRKMSIPVNKENVLKYGILSESFADSIPDEIVISIPEGKDYLSKPELFMLDLLSSYQWDRPINMLSQGGDINIGLKDYLMYESFSSKFVPIRNKMTTTGLGKVDINELEYQMDSVFKWDALKRTDYFADYQNLYTFLGVLPQRDLFLNAANQFIAAGKKDKAIAILDKCQESVPAASYPLETICLGFYQNDISVIGMVEAYMKAGAIDKGKKLGDEMSAELIKSIRFYIEYYDMGKDEFELCCNCLYYLADTYKKFDDAKSAEELINSLEKIIKGAVES